jgi:hypothetical protein
MPTGLKQTSSLITIGFNVDQTGIDVFTQGRVDLQLNPLDNEVFVVQAINLDAQTPDVNPGLDTLTNSSLTSTSKTAVANLSDSNCLANARDEIRSNPALAATSAGVAFSTNSMETPPSGLEYIGIIATNDFFIQVNTANSLNTKGVSGKMYGYRAKASSSIYAALVQSELLSA